MGPDKRETLRASSTDDLKLMPKIYSCLDLPRGPSLRLSLHLPHFKQGVEFSSSWPGVPFCLGDSLLFSLSERKQR